MHSMTKVVILLLLFNAIEYSMSAIDDGCDATNRGKVFIASNCGEMKISLIKKEPKDIPKNEMPKDLNKPFPAIEGNTPSECCKRYMSSCYKEKAVSNTCVCETTSQLTFLCHS